MTGHKFSLKRFLESEETHLSALQSADNGVRFVLMVAYVYSTLNHLVLQGKRDVLTATLAGLG